ncbi:unnamed protein product [Chondrus crispus]|uniref:Uncharacterized protein n=1 Tax=Chondrus crispus TaxID=2769 RepID=R7QTM8_CHOCR|nr:unnamed protein product [Chondrus crispus]CDF40730.1 unnamed protein product [Chondrus crispus]|eukprot:XP_005711024.1 unnamed protein product [Chondrus crispus]
MCGTCCTHANVLKEFPCTHPSSKLYHIGVFTLYPDGVLFPGERATLDIFLASALRLISALQTTGLPLHPTPPSWLQAPTIPITDAFAIVSDPIAPVGAIAVFDPDLTTGSSTTHYPTFTRVRIRIAGRFSRAAPIHHHAPFPCAQVRLICDSHLPSLRVPLSEDFPYLNPAPAARKRAASRPIKTRAAAAGLAAVRYVHRRRTSAFMGGLDYAQWRACTPQVLAHRARTLAMYSRLDIDGSLIEWRPCHEACPGVWSFWLCAALPADTVERVLHELLGTSCLVTRLRWLIELFKSRPRKRSRAQLEEDKPYQPSSSRKRTRKSVRQALGEEQLLQVKALTNAKGKKAAMASLLDGLRARPWPSSPAKGFQRVDLSSPVKGRFRITLPSMSDTTRVKLNSPSKEGTTER